MAEIDPLAIFDAANSQDWTRVLELCSSFPHFNFASHKGADGMTALHAACLHQCQDIEVFEALLEASPESLLVQDNKGMVPLHYACRFQAPAEVVGRLLHLHPEQGLTSASIRDRKGRTPLFYAERHDSPASVVEMLRDTITDANVGTVEDTGAEEDACRRESLERQTSFARSFFNSSGNSADFVASAFVASNSLLDEVSDFHERSDSQKWMEDAMRQQQQYQQRKQGGGDWESPWGVATENGPPARKPDGVGEHLPFDERDILEQHRIMAQHEAYLRLKKITGFDMEEYNRHSDDKMPHPTVGKVNASVRRKALLTPQLPAPRRVTVTSSSKPQLQEPMLPSLADQKVRFGCKAILPDVLRGVIVSNRGRHDPVEPGEEMVNCLGCKRQLKVKKTAIYVSCPNCGAESPAISINPQHAQV